MMKALSKLRIRTVAVFVLIVYLAVQLVMQQVELVTKRREYNSLIDQRDRLTVVMNETKVMLELEDEGVYIEQVARERLGYAMPGEIVFYDIRAS